MADSPFIQPVVFSQTPNDDPDFPNARGIGVGEGLQITDGGPNNNVTISPAKLLQTIEALVPGGIIAKDTLDNAYVRSIQNGTGIAVTNGDGVAGDPTISVVPGTTKQLTQVMFNGESVGFPRGNVNFVPGSGIGMYINDDGSNINVNISASGGGGGPSDEIHTNLIETVTPNAVAQLWPDATAAVQLAVNSEVHIGDGLTNNDLIYIGNNGNNWAVIPTITSSSISDLGDGNGLDIRNQDGNANLTIGCQSPGKLVLGGGDSGNVEISAGAGVGTSVTMGFQSGGTIDIGNTSTGGIYIGTSAGGDINISAAGTINSNTNIGTSGGTGLINIGTTSRPVTFNGNVTIAGTLNVSPSYLKAFAAAGVIPYASGTPTTLTFPNNTTYLSNNFTWTAPGVLTYTGTNTQICMLNVSCSTNTLQTFIDGNMRFAYSINGGTPPFGGTVFVPLVNATAAYYLPTMTINDIVSFNPGDTITFSFQPTYSYTSVSVNLNVAIVGLYGV